MKTKLEMAHEFMLAMIGAGCSDGPDLLDRSWQYADAMQAEADKREKEKVAQSKHVFEAIDEWQPDWSQAPKEYPTVTGWYLFRNKAHWICDDVPCGPAPTFGITGNHIVERCTI